jgi:hypothetical protein
MMTWRRPLTGPAQTTPMVDDFLAYAAEHERGQPGS